MVHRFKEPATVFHLDHFFGASLRGTKQFH
jgi:hypothetical protein